MRNDMFNKEITDVTLHGEDIRGASLTNFGTGNELKIRTRDKEYLVQDEGHELFNSLRRWGESKEGSDDKAKFPSITLFGRIPYRDLNVTKFTIVEEPDPEPKSSLDKARELMEAILRNEKQAIAERVERMEYALRHCYDRNKVKSE